MDLYDPFYLILKNRPVEKGVTVQKVLSEALTFGGSGEVHDENDYLAGFEL